MLYVQCVGLAEDVAYPLKPLSSQATRSHPGKAKTYEPKALNETMLPAVRKKGDSHQEQEKVNKRKRMKT